MFHVFAGDKYYPAGGMLDYKTRVDTLEEALRYIANNDFDWWHITNNDFVILQ